MGLCHFVYFSMKGMIIMKLIEMFVLFSLFPVFVLCMFVYCKCCRTQLQHSDSDCSRSGQSAPCLRVWPAGAWLHLEEKTTIKLQKYNVFERYMH